MARIRVINLFFIFPPPMNRTYLFQGLIQFVAVFLFFEIIGEYIDIEAD